jgi:cyclopropane-fatty-acyl-phospholipid synthase
MKLLMILGALLALIVGLFVAGVPYVLQQPGMAFKATQTLVRLGNVPESIFDQIEVVDETAWYDVVTKANLGLAESYMSGKLKFDPLKLFFTLLNGTSLGTRRAEGGDGLKYIMQAINMPANVVNMLFNQQTKDKSTRVTTQHYDVGNDLYEVMLGPTMSYTCAYWKGADNLTQAQTNKFDLIKRKLELEEGMEVADLGMGWGTAAAYMHEHGKVKVTGVSLSTEQVKWASANLAKPGLQFIWQDYRDHCDDPKFQGKYDRVYSIGMLEHVGYKNYYGFFECIKKLLKPDGLAVVHTIGEPDFVPVSDAFLDKYIFPGAVIPTLAELTPAMEKSFILEDFQNFGYDYARTLKEWAINSRKFFKDKPDAYTPEFQRMWFYYLNMCEALFEIRINQLWHFVLSPRPATRKRIDRQL